MEGQEGRLRGQRGPPVCQRQTFPFYTLPTAHLQDFCPWGMLLCTSCPIFCASAAFSRFSSSLRSKWKECVPKEVVAGPVAPAPPVAHAWVVLVKNTRLAWGTQCEVALHLFLHVSILPALLQPLPDAPSTQPGCHRGQPQFRGTQLSSRGLRLHPWPDGLVGRFPGSPFRAFSLTADLPQPARA